MGGVRPATIMSRHGPYTGIAGLFAHSTDFPTDYRDGTAPPEPSNPQDVTGAAHYLCAIATSNGIDCAVMPVPGKHKWQVGAKVFADALPWLAGRLGTPGVAAIALPGVHSPG
jgi:S-formylglutathione hydrolase FrmB